MAVRWAVFSAPPATAYTMQSACRASCTSNCPTPPAALCTSTRMPARNGQATRAMYQAVAPCVPNANEAPSDRSSGTTAMAR